MKEPVKIVVDFDYVSPWCYIAAVRLQKIEEEYGDKINICWRSYPLAPQQNPEMQFTPRTAEAWQRAAQEENINFNPWDPHQTYPTSSMPALQATKCAQLQGEEAFRRFHTALFKAFFEESMNISDREVLIGLAKKTGLDIERFSANFDGGAQEKEVLAEYEGGRAEYEGWGVPLVIIGGHYPVQGAAPIDVYRRAIDLCLASHAG